MTPEQTAGSNSYDVIVIGGGPGGYVAAIRCAQLGLATVCIDAQVNASGEPSLGGTCLNVGCIPSKALLDSSEQFARIQQHADSHGISVKNPTMDVKKMLARKDGIVGKLTGGISQLFQANKVESIHGYGQLKENRTVTVSDVNNGEVIRTLTASHIILAPGSSPVELPSIPFDHELIVDSTDALCFTKVPKRLGIIGAGVIGLELGSVWNRLGAEVVILEAVDEFLAAADHQIAREAARQFKQQGLQIHLGAMVERVDASRNSVKMQYLQDKKAHTLEVDRVIVAVGRRPTTTGLVSPGCGVSVDSAGFIEVDEKCQTKAENVWAVGDAVRGPMLAHKSSEEGVAVAERIAGGVGHVNLANVPWVIYTAPEIAWVGQTEKQLQEQGIAFRTGAFPFAATGRALAMEEPAGMVKMIAHEKTDRLLGVHIIGAHASELIAECVLAMEYQASSEDLARTIHAHPTLSEAVHEAALAVDGRAIHKAPPRARKPSA